MNKKQQKSSRRNFLKGLGGIGLSVSVASQRAAAAKPKFDVLVVGSGVFGIWTAYRLHHAGFRVCVVDAVSPGHSRASSGGESRVIRAGYGDQEIYTEWAWQSLEDWRQLSDRASLPLFRPLGVLWLHQVSNPLVVASAKMLSSHSIPFRFLDAGELRARYPVINVADNEAGFLEPAAGGLMARRAVQHLAAELAADGVSFIDGAVNPIGAGDASDGVLPAVITAAGEKLEAEQFVFACGPWLDRVCPEAMKGRLFVTRQEVYYFGVDAAATGALPIWADLPFYGFPDVEGRGFKVADDTHGPALDPETANRLASEAGEERAREFLASRFPTIADAPLSENRVCQYANTSDGHFVIDRHPGLGNVWVVGGGSGHGFKHGPAIGRHVAELVAAKARPRAPFTLASKARIQNRIVQ